MKKFHISQLLATIFIVLRIAAIMADEPELHELPEAEARALMSTLITHDAQTSEALIKKADPSVVHCNVEVNIVPGSSELHQQSGGEAHVEIQQKTETGTVTTQVEGSRTALPGGKVIDTVVYAQQKTKNTPPAAEPAKTPPAQQKQPYAQAGTPAPTSLQALPQPVRDGRDLIQLPDGSRVLARDVWLAQQCYLNHAPLFDALTTAQQIAIKQSLIENGPIACPRLTASERSRTMEMCSSIGKAHFSAGIYEHGARGGYQAMSDHERDRMLREINEDLQHDLAVLRQTAKMLPGMLNAVRKRLKEKAKYLGKKIGEAACAIGRGVAYVGERVVVGAQAAIDCVRRKKRRLRKQQEQEERARQEALRSPRQPDPEPPEEPEEPENQQTEHDDPQLIEQSFTSPDCAAWLARDAVRQAQEAATILPSCPSYAARLTERAQKLMYATQHFDEQCTVDQPLPCAVYEQWPEAHEFDRCEGNLFQQALHDELRDNLACAAQAAATFKDDYYVQSQIPSVYTFSDIARIHENPVVAFALSSTGYVLLKIAELCGRWQEHAADLMRLPQDQSPMIALGVVSSALAKAIGRTAEHFALYCEGDSGEQFVRDMASLWRLGKGVVKIVYTVIAGSDEQRQELYERWLEVKTWLKENPDEPPSALFLLMCPGPANKLFSAVRRTATLAKISLTLRAQEQLAKAISIIKQTVKPQRYAVAAGNSTRIIVSEKDMQALAEPVRSMNKAINKQHQKRLGAYPGSLTDLAYKMEQAPLFENLDHIFKWEEKPNRITGFHHVGEHGDKLIPELMCPPDQHGIFCGYWRHGDYEKFSTFFPRHWSREKVLEKIEEAFRNPIAKESFYTVGKTTEGIFIKTIFCKGAGVNNVHRLTAFALYEGLDISTKEFIKRFGRTDVCINIKNLGK